jgi:ABC-type transport system involved in cytochrome c biogenesis ATPase subunit
MKKEYYKRRSTKTLTEQVEEHFKYMGHKGWHKNKLKAWDNPLWRPEKKGKEVKEID